MPSTKYENTVIDKVHSLKYLGITIDRSLSYNHHVNEIIRKAKQGIIILKLLANMNMPQRILCHLMQIVVLSKIDYGIGL
jgi:hypothetical protein